MRFPANSAPGSRRWRLASLGMLVPGECLECHQVKDNHPNHMVNLTLWDKCHKDLECPAVECLLVELPVVCPAVVCRPAQVCRQVQVKEWAECPRVDHPK